MKKKDNLIIVHFINIFVYMQGSINLIAIVMEGLKKRILQM